VRWRDDQGNLRQPQELLMALQNTQLLWQLDRIVVEKSIEVLSQRPKVRLSINLSHEIFTDQTFLDHFQAWLSHYNVSAKRLSFEFEEVIFSQMPASAIALITALQQMGCYLVIDNFTGTYFTLMQLQALPIAMIKLDRNFGQKSLNPDQKQLAMAIAHTSRIFKIQCIVKGIDNQYALQFADDIGAKGVQGYALSQPENKPKILLAGLLFTRIIGFLILLYMFKSLIGIDLFPNRHGWEVIRDWGQSLVELLTPK